MTPEDRRRLEERRARRIARQRRERRLRILLCVLIIVVVVAIVAVVGLIMKKHFASQGASQKPETKVEQTLSAEDEDSQEAEDGSADVDAEEPSDEVEEVEVQTPAKTYAYAETDATKTINTEEVISQYSLLVNVDDGTVVAQNGYKERMNPASMTKILTVLVAAEHITDSAQLEETVPITIDITDYVYKNDGSAVGFSLDEQVPVKDLFYGTILPSGADAAVALATYVAGSHEAFVDMMNEKLEELGIADTAHFTNCVGMYDENHYCTLEDMAIILNAAMDNELAREALSAHKYTTTSTEQHPEGIDISNWFLRRIEDKDCGGTVVGAKTGFVNQSGNCAASYFTSNDGKNFICVTGGSTSSWRCIYDHVAIYNIFAVGNTSYTKE